MAALLVLGIETAGDVGGVALYAEGEVPYEFRFPARRRHAERLAPAVEALLREANASPKGLDLVAVDVGPGSFTGVRIGMAFAKALAQAIGVPLVGVRQSEALGLPVAEWWDGRVAVLIHDRRDLVYLAIASGDRISEDSSLPLSEALRKIPADGGICLVGSGTLRFRRELEEAFPKGYILGEPWAYPSAGVVAKLGYRRFREEGPTDPKQLEPNYVQPPLAKEGRRHGKGM